MTRALAGAALAALCALQALALLRAPAAWMPAQVDVALARGADVHLDHAALGAPAGDGGQLRISRAADGSWRAADDGTGRPLLVQDGVHHFVIRKK